MTIYLLRHGQVANPQGLLYGRLPGFPLSDQGREEVKRASNCLKKIGISKIYSSPIDRAKETAAIVRQELKLEQPVVVDDRLTEIDAGRWAGRKRTDFFKESQYLEDPYAERGYENYSSVAARFQDFVDNLPKDDKVLVVSHRDTILLGILGLAKEPAVKLHRMFLPTGGVYELDLDSPLNYRLICPGGEDAFYFGQQDSPAGIV